ncbi:P-loop containing nucleoside triphosphate hydrolase protein [Mycena floridula]|nr:P-loop containing nucleoside triphosphate hydrolase protein [Mycena floridula]
MIRIAFSQEKHSFVPSAMSTPVCPSARAGLVCTKPTCQMSHNVPNCEACSRVFIDENSYRGHLKGKAHLDNVRGIRNTAIHYCPVCELHTPDGQRWSVHVATKRHKAKATLHGVNSADVQPEEPAAEVPGHKFCLACNVHVPDHLWKRHPTFKSHIAKQTFTKYRAALDEAEADKNGVTVTEDFDFKIVEQAQAKQGITTKGVIQLGVPSAKVTLVEAVLASSKGAKASSPFVVTFQGTNRIFTSNSPLRFTLRAQQDYIGRSSDRLDLIFEDQQLQSRFLISRSLHIIVGSKAEHESLKPTAPYKPRKRSARPAETEVVEGVAPPSLKAIPYVTALPKSPIPKRLAAILSTGTVADALRQIREVFLPSHLNSGTYASYFKYLLWIEEQRMEQDLEHYDIDQATLSRHNNYHYLDVPGLAEKRPSVLVGDSILIQKQEDTSGRWFEGRVHVVRKEEVGLRFHGSFRAVTAGQRFRVRFKLNRYPMRRQHLAMDTTFSQDRVLFPEPQHLPSSTVITAIRSAAFRNALIASNPAQARAVASIVNRAPGSIPFVVFGPPGTGKTVTIVESILQLLAKDPNSRILACAPSNSAADIIATQLVSLYKLSKADLFRAYAPSRAKDQVPTELRNHHFTNVDGHFSVPPMDIILRYRVIVVTCVSASMIPGIGIRRGHFSHIFIDEAGQATEPEAMISIKTMADNKTNIVLSGDPKQLGPIIRSTIARQLDFETSYIERLMQREIYSEAEGQPIAVVKLTKNFRSHAAILKFPDEMFYRGELECCGKPQVINAYTNSVHVARKGFPVVFYSTSGKDQREASSPSFFNIDEVIQVKTIIQRLRADKAIRISDNDIGVIAPYHAQCLKLRKSLSEGAASVKVGSVEEFQGQERKVIIISTVRSSRDFVEYDLKHTLGFVASPRRFNVAVTRAQALLVIVGDPSVLSLDPLWRSFLNYIHVNGGWKGPGPTWDTTAPVDPAGGYDQEIREAETNDMNEFARAMEALTLGNIEDGNVDRPWNDRE